MSSRLSTSFKNPSFNIVSASCSSFSLWLVYAGDVPEEVSGVVQGKLRRLVCTGPVNEKK